MDEGIPIVNQLIQQSIDGQPYSLTGTELTQKMVDKFNTVVSLQSFILAHSLQVAHKDYHQAQRTLF